MFDRIPTAAPRAVFLGGNRIVFRDDRVSRPGPGELLLRVAANAVCGTDRAQYAQGSSVTPGHEASGIVIAVGEGTSTDIGTRGVVYLMDFCGECASCVHGLTNQCLAKRADMGFTHDGGYGAYELVHETNFFPVPPDLDLALATMLLDVMGTSGHALDRARLIRDDIKSVLVVGAGPVGLGTVAMALATLPENPRVYASDVQPYRLGLVEALGATSLDVRDRSLADALAASGAPAPDVVIDTSGVTAVREAAMVVLGKRGVFVCVGHGGGLSLDVSADLIAPERAVLGSEYFPYSGLAGNLSLLIRQPERFAPIITHRFPLDRIGDAFEAFLSGETGKVVVTQ
jgi:threonine dehydrogenase-like Zn-dependent dehydrogenase